MKIEPIRRDLAAIISGGRASTALVDKIAYARDLWPRHHMLVRGGEPAPSPPGIVVWPGDTREVAEIVRYASERGLPLVPYGAGSGVCGGILPTPTSIVVDLKRLRALRSVDAERLEAVAGAGIIGQHLEDYLGDRGFTLGHFPSSIYCSTLGGWIAGRSAGQCSGRYGKIEDMVLGLEMVDGRGEILRASQGGPDEALLPLVIGSEGTLAIVTEARLRVAPAPRERRFAAYEFPETIEGLEALRHLYQAGLRPAVGRLYDPFDSYMARRGKVKGEPKGGAGAGGQAPGLGTRLLVRALRRPSALNELVELVPSKLFGGAMLILVWESEPSLAEAELLEAKRICAQLGGRDLGEGPGRRWLAHRHSVSYRQSPILAGGGFLDTMEVAATWSRMFPMYLAVRAALAPHVFVMAHFSHAYPDGASIYFTFAGSRSSEEESLAAYDRTWKAALQAVTDAGGTLSHHHGVGRSKAAAMRREQGAAIDVVRELKHVLDPQGILNPGTLIPLEPAS
ncbi:MAG: FAD-binding oxidoreductase [Myxococcales bacterium]|nr:FAD-binding oxidoreductase [Myxococcales bacterium]